MTNPDGILSTIPGDRPSSPAPRTGPVPAVSGCLSEEQAIEMVCMDMVRRWRRGEPVLVEAYLSLHPALPPGESGFLELLDCEHALRRERGETPAVEGYIGRFPNQEEGIRRQLALDGLTDDRSVGANTIVDGSRSRSRPNALAPGPSIPGFAIEVELGRGGMGVVYKARQLGLGRTVALKMIAAGDPTATARFRAEAEAIARLHHPNVVQVYAVGEHDGRPYLVMEYLPGGSLGQQLDGTPRSPRASAILIGALVRGIAEAHRAGVIHRDLKPDNILLDDQGTPKIADFGLAKLLDSDSELTRSGALLGSPSYMAPEQAAGTVRAIGPAADVHALGVLLYELLTGRPPFRGATVAEMLEQVKSAEPVSPSRLMPGLSRDLETICLKCLQKEPSRRYAGAEALAEDLRRFLAREPILARRAGPVERLGRWCRRNAVVAALIAALFASLTLGLAGTAWKWREAVERGEVAIGARRDADEARHQAIRQRDNSRQLSAELALDKGIALSEEGQADRGLLWMLEALKTAPGDATAFRRLVRLNLGAWLGQVHKPLRIVNLGIADPHVEAIFSPDGRTFAAGAEISDRGISLWETATGRKLGTFPDCLFHAAFGPDGKVCFAHTRDRTRLIAFDVATKRPIWTTAPMPERGLRIAVGPDGSTVFTSRTRDLIRPWKTLLWDAATGRARGEPLDVGGTIGISRDGRILWGSRSVGDEVFIALLDLAEGRPVASWPASKPTQRMLRMSPDATVLYENIFDAKGLPLEGRVWDIATRQPIGPTLFATDHGAFLPAGDRLLTNTDGAVVVRDIAGGRTWGTEIRGGSGITSIDPHPDGRTLLTVGVDQTARLWEISPEAVPLADSRRSGQEVPTTAPSPSDRSRKEPRSRSQWSSLRPDGRVALSWVAGPSGRAMIQARNPATGEPIGAPARHRPWKVRVMAFSPDGHSYATGSDPAQPGGLVAGEIRLWDAGTGRLSLPPIAHTNYVSALAFRPDGRVLAAGDFHELVRFWDPATGKEVGQPLPQGEIVLGLAYSRDGKTLAVALAKDRTRKPGVRLWDVATGRSLGEVLPHRSNVLRLEFRPDGLALAAADEMGTTRLWDTTAGRAIGEPMFEETAAVFRPDGTAFATAGKDGTVRLRDAATGALIRSFRTNPSPARCVAFRGDGDLLAVGFEDGSVRLWDPATSRTIGPPRTINRAVLAVTFTPDGREIVGLDECGSARAWPVPQPLEGSDLDEGTLRVEALTGLRMGPDRSVMRLDAAAWQDRIAQADRLEATRDRSAGEPDWHLGMARDADEQGNAFAEIWHLDRLIAARPDDWNLHARRARARLSSGALDKAAADSEWAHKLGARPRVLDREAHCVIDRTAAERRGEALWYLDRLIAARPDDWTLYDDRAGVYDQLGRKVDRDADIARAIDLGADVALVLPRAEELARAGRWDQAAALVAGCGRRGPLDTQLARAWALTCLNAGDHTGYREACSAVVTRTRPRPTVVRDELTVAALATLGDAGLDDYSVPIGWLETRLSRVPPPSSLMRHIISNALGGLLLRAGRVETAIARLDEGLAASTEPNLPMDWCLLALAHARLGDHAAARRCFDRARAWRPSGNPGAFWDDMTIDRLRREAETVILGDSVFPTNPFAPSESIP